MLKEKLGRKNAARTTIGAKFPQDSLYRTFYDAIASRELHPGQKLTEETIGDTFNVGRSLVRSMLRRLADDGLVEIVPNRGAFVAQPPAKEARDVFETRRMIEGALVANLKDLPRKSILLLHEHLLQEDEAQRTRDNKKLFQLGAHFHILLAQITNNSVLENMIRDLVTRSVLAVAIYQRSAGEGCRTDQHRSIVQLLEASNYAEASHCMVHHLHTVENLLALDDHAAQEPDLRATLAAIKKAR